MITSYIQAALHRATYDILEDHTFYAEIPGLYGVLATATTLEECREQLREVLEEWILLGLKLGHELPLIDDIDLNRVLEPA